MNGVLRGKNTLFSLQVGKFCEPLNGDFWGLYGQPKRVKNMILYFKDKPYSRTQTFQSYSHTVESGHEFTYSRSNYTAPRGISPAPVLVEYMYKVTIIFSREAQNEHIKGTFIF